MFQTPEFSWKTRETALQRFRKEEFDFLIVGGGITGAATARDAASRGLKVALVERRDFAWGTSSRSSKLIHGGFRYLEHGELKLVFESLAERALLLKTAPGRVDPLVFYLPIYRGSAKGRFFFGAGLWLYDLLALLRTPGFHRWLPANKTLQILPGLKADGLLGALRYFDAGMLDDLLAVDTLRSAQSFGAVAANYVEALSPVWTEKRITGFRVRDIEKGEDIIMRAKQVVVCAGPWTDQMGLRLTSGWKNWLEPSKGIHLVFDARRFPVSGAVVMRHPDDGRFSFVISRPDLGAGIVLVGTTDAPTPGDPDSAFVSRDDISYLMDLLRLYFPKLDLKVSDIISTYVGVRPLMATTSQKGDGMLKAGDLKTASALQKVSREHYIGAGPGDVVLVAGGKYTTHRPMAKEIVDFSLKILTKGVSEGKVKKMTTSPGPSKTREPVNPVLLSGPVNRVRKSLGAEKNKVPHLLWRRYGADALEVLKLHRSSDKPNRPDPDGFPLLAAQLKYAMHHEMVLHLEDFFIRRVPLFLSRVDHGLPWVERLAQVWAEESGGDVREMGEEISRLKTEIEKRSEWKKIT